jgi:hypothetical protein
MCKKILILTGRSLFADGVISKLSSSPMVGELEVVDLRQADPLQAIAAANPDFLILDETDPEITEQLKSELFTLFSNLKVIILDPQKNSLRVLRCEEYDNSQIWNLLADEPDSSSSRNVLSPGLTKDINNQLNTNLPV